MLRKHKRLALISNKEKKIYIMLVVIVMFLFIISTVFTKYNPLQIFPNMHYFVDFVTKDFFPPDFHDAKGLGKALVQTFQMAIGASFMAAILAFILAFLGSNTTSPSPWIARFIRLIGSFFRNIPELIWALILVMAFGIGTSVGLIALFIESFGFLLRAYIETIDDVGIDVLEALDAVGANFFQKIMQGIIPSAVNGYISWFLYCVEVNIRASTIIGLVGGGGIGLVLMSYIKSFKYHIAFAIILAIAFVIILVDILTNRLRRRLIY